MAENLCSRLGTTCFSPPPPSFLFCTPHRYAGCGFRTGGPGDCGGALQLPGEARSLPSALGKFWVRSPISPFIWCPSRPPRLLTRLPGCFAPGGEIVALRCFAKIETFVAQGASPGMDICWSMCLAGVGGEVDLHWGPSCVSASGYVRGGFGYYIHLEIDSGPTDPKCRPRGPLRSPTFPLHSRRTYTASPSPCLPCGCECWGYGLGQPPRTNICNGRRGFDRARTVYLIANRWSNTDQFPKLQRLGTCTTLNFRAVRRSYYRAFGAEHSESSTARAFNL